MKFKFITYVLFGVILPIMSQAMYTKQEDVIAQKVLQQSLPRAQYYPVLEVSAEENKTGKSAVYRDEYGVCVLVKNDKLQNLLQQVNEFAYPESDNRPEITPHITIVQGIFKKDTREALAEAVRQAALDTKTHPITFSNHFVKGGGDNIFLEVEKGNDFFNVLNARLTQAV